jgi:pyruvate-ferredoxin/flavodoxin oxidoreductase
LFRYNPTLRDRGENPFVLDSPRPMMSFRDYAYEEIRYRSLAQSRPEEAEKLLAAAQAAVLEKYRTYEEMAGWSATRFHPVGVAHGADAAEGYPNVPHPEWEQIGVRG